MRKANKSKNSSALSPYFLAGHVILDFWNNDDITYRDKALRTLQKELSSKINISILIASDDMDNPERGKLVIAAIALGSEQINSLKQAILNFIDDHSPARLVDDEWIAEELPF